MRMLVVLGLSLLPWCAAAQMPGPAPARPAPATAASVATGPTREIGQVKTATGEAYLVRAGARIPAMPGAVVQEADAVETGPNGSIGITFSDNSLFSAGPGSRVSFDKFRYEPQTMSGESDTNVQQGTAFFVSGDLARRNPGNMRVRSKAMVLGVRGTEFAVFAEP